MGDEWSLRSGAQVIGPHRQALARAWREDYEAGSSLRSIAGASGRSYGFVRAVVVESGASLRSRGGSRRTGVKQPSPSAATSSPAAVVENATEALGSSSAMI